MKGTLTVDGRALGGQDVFALSDGRLVETTVTDDNGTFSVDDDRGGALTLLAKIRGGAFGLVARAVERGESADLALDDAHTLELEIAGDDLPELLDLQLDPVALDGVDGALLSFATLRPDGLADPCFGHRVVDTGGARLRLQGGTWRLRARWEDPDRFDAPSYSGDAVVEVSGDARVTLRVVAAT